jgi:hypothetical protein
MALWRLCDLGHRSVIHKANPDYDMNERRYLYRPDAKGRDASLIEGAYTYD